MATAGYQLTEEDCQAQECIEREGEVYAPGVLEEHLVRLRRVEATRQAHGRTHARTHHRQSNYTE